MNTLALTTTSCSPCSPYEGAKVPCSESDILQKKSSSLKATVFRTCLNNQVVVTKDFSRSSPLLRHTGCRILLKREVRAMKRLEGIRGVPKFLGWYGSHGFTMEYVDGVQWDKAAVEQNPGLLDQLNELVQAMHSRGVTHNDIRKRNLLVSPQGQLYLIDFAATCFRPTNPLSPMHYVFTLTRFIDRTKIEKFRHKYGDTVSTGEQQGLGRSAKVFQFLSRFWKKRIYVWF